MIERKAGREREPELEKGRLMSAVVAQTAGEIRLAITSGNLEGIKKSVAFEKAMVRLPEGLKGLQLKMTGDNWLWRDPKTEAEEALMPDRAASIGLVERDDKGNIKSCAVTAIGKWTNEAIYAEEQGVFIYDGEGKLQKIKAVNPVYLSLPPKVQIFGQKFTDHWVAMNSVIGQLNKKGIRTNNDCGPYFALQAWFNSAKDKDGRLTITPDNMVYIEPYDNKPKEQMVAFIMKCLNDSLPENSRFVLTNMSGLPVFREGKFEQVAEGLYSSSGFIIAPTIESHRIVMGVLREVVLANPAFASSAANQKMQNLRNALSAFK